jgi:glycosyltransferase involved in cell wall biosynthesis
MAVVSSKRKEVKMVIEKTRSLPISVVIFTKNEELNIEECIKSCKDFSEITVLDSESHDKTIEIAMQLKVNVVDFVWNKKYPKKRQWALDNLDLKNEWILFLDADERITRHFVEELESKFILLNEKYSAAEIKLDYVFLGKCLKFGAKPRKLTLLKRNHAKYAELNDLNFEGMGELEGHYQPEINGLVYKFRSSILHNDNDPLVDWYRRHISYAMWEAKVLESTNSKSLLLASKPLIARVFYRLPFKPFLFFSYSFFLRLGFLDGRAGFQYAAAKAWYYSLINQIK